MSMRMLIATMLMTAALPAMATKTPSTSLAPPPPTPPAQVPATAAANTQVEALAFVIALDEGLADLAEQALGRPVQSDIRELALTASADLRAHASITRELAVDAKAKLVDTTETKASRDQSRLVLEELAKAKDADYGTEFLKTLIAEDGKALDLLDKRLIAQATDDRIAKHMQATRTKIAGHQLRAQELQSSGK